MISILKKSIITITIWLLIFPMATLSNDEFVVKDIKIEGLEKISEGALLNYLPVNIGDSLNESRIQESIRSVYSSGFFKNIEFRKDDSGVLIISVLERPSIASINFEGNKDIKTEDLEDSLNNIGFKIGRNYDPSILDEIERSLIDQYFSFGKYNARVKTTVEELPGNTVGVQVDVSEGDRAQIRQINVVGNKIFSDEDILDILKLQMPNWLSFFNQDDRYSREDLQGDLETIENFYLDQGYANFRIESAQVAISKDKQGIFVTINITEDEVYTLSDVKVTGEFVIPKEEIEKFIFAKPGQTFSQGLLTSITELIEYELGEDGYSFAEVEAVPELDRENKEVKVVFYIQPKDRVYVRRISFTDTTSINDDVLRREMRQLEGGYYSKSKLERSKIRLQRLPFIEEVNYETYPVPGSTDLVDAEFNIKEGLPGQFGGGIGYSGYQKLILNGNFTHTNFFGTGNRVGLDINASRFRDLYSISTTNAYTGIDEISRTLSLSYSNFSQFTSSSSDFSTKTYSLGAQYSYPLSEFQRLIFGGSLQSSELLAGDYSADQALQWVTSNGKSECFDQEFFDFCKTKFDNAELTAGWVYDSRNRFMFADQGMSHRLILNASIPGSDVEYYGINYAYKQYFNIPFPIINRLTMMVKADLAFNDAYGDSIGVPPYKNFYAGGPDTVRGFKEHRLGPKDNYGNPYGGNLLISSQTEFILPIPGDWANRARFSLFFDIGNTFSTSELDFFDPEGNPIDYSFDASKLKRSYGLAAQWLAPMGLFRFSYAIPMNSIDGTDRFYSDETERFQFTVGGAF
ncbi:MAG: outer membrane protein assembly factor BamA [Gammaproteobacteria bacterium]|nr:outer membrane protein assembly factor BamA [Gammaproteobacteria bacterium]HAH67519.1 outer membrane protein assembly factor BamA [Gammaproteobacteria bacterium]